MPKVTLDLNIKEAKHLIKQMPWEDKIKLIKELMKESWTKRIDNIIKNIDQRRKKYRISSQRISQEIKNARKEFYGHRH